MRLTISAIRAGGRPIHANGGRVYAVLVDGSRQIKSPPDGHHREFLLERRPLDGSWWIVEAGVHHNARFAGHDTKEQALTAFWAWLRFA